jgi:hypothetical protein
LHRLARAVRAPGAGGRIAPDGSVQVDEHHLPADVVAAFIVVSMADTCEQWFAWQEDIYSGFPTCPGCRRPHWMAALWPGPCARPAASTPTSASWAPARTPGHPGLAHAPWCVRALHAHAGDEAAEAASLYWSVIAQSQPLVQMDGAVAALEHAARLNPGWASRRWCWPSCT